MNTVYEFGDGRKTAMPSDDLIDVDIDDYYGGDKGPDPDSQSGHAESDLPYPEDANDPAFAETGWTARRASRKQAMPQKYVDRPIEGFVAGDKFINRWRQVVTIREIKRNENGEFVVFIEEEDIWPFPLYYETGKTLRTFANDSYKRSSRKQASVPTLTYLSDPEHGWLGVPIDLFPDAPSFSTGYSYYDSKTNTIWLEEDGEAPKFKRAHEGEFTIFQEITDDDAFVRSLPVMQITPVASRSNKGNAVSKLSPSEAARLRKFRATVQRNAPKVAFEWPKELGRTEDGITVSQHRASGAIQVDYLGDNDDDYLRSMTYFGYTIEEAIDLFREELGLSGSGYIAMQSGASKRRSRNAPKVATEMWHEMGQTADGITVYRTQSGSITEPAYVDEDGQLRSIRYYDYTINDAIDAFREGFELPVPAGEPYITMQFGSSKRSRGSRRPVGKAASRRGAVRKTAYDEDYGDGLDVRMLMVDLDRREIGEYIEEQEISGFTSSSYKEALVDFVLSKATSNEDAIKRANAALNDMALVGYDSANEIQAEVYDYLKENGIDDEWDRLRGEWKAHLRQARTASRQGGRRPFVPSRNDIRRRGTLKTARVSGGQLNELSDRLEALNKRFTEARVVNSAYLLMVEGRILTQMSRIADDASLQDVGGTDFPFAIHDAMVKFSRLHPLDEDGAEESLYEYAMKAVGVLERNFDALVESARGERADSWSTMGSRGRRKMAGPFSDDVDQYHEDDGYAEYAEGVEDGRAAFHAGKPAVPYSDEVARPKLVGQPGESLSYLEGWSKGWMEENLKAPVPGWTEEENLNYQRAIGSRRPTSRRRKTAMPSPEETGVKVGDFFVHSWGYEQTNTDFYEVVGLTGASVKVRQTQKEVVSGHDTTSEMVVPIPSSSYGRGGVMTKRLKVIEYGSGPRVVIRINDFTGYASLWDGTPKRQTGANWGH